MYRITVKNQFQIVKTSDGNPTPGCSSYNTRDCDNSCYACIAKMCKILDE